MKEINTMENEVESIQDIRDNIELLELKQKQLSRKFSHTVGAKEIQRLIGEMTDITTQIRAQEEKLESLIG